MWKRCWLTVGLICVIGIPVGAYAQDKEDPEDFGRDVVGAVFHSNWNVYLHGGLTTHGRFLLQRPGPAAPLAGERDLRTQGAFNAGIGAGVDILKKTGFRFSYTYGSSDFAFRTDNGNGSEDLDIENVGGLQSHVAAVEVIQYFVNAKASFSPYATFGGVGTWWVMDEEPNLLVARSNTTQFRFGALGSLGVQARVADRWSLRLEAASASIRNPFAGKESFNALGGVTIDEPTRVNKTDFRLAAVYKFGQVKEERRVARRRARR